MAKSELNEYYKVIKGLNRARFLDEVIRWAKEANPADVHKWKEIAKVYLRDYGWNRGAAKDFFDLSSQNRARCFYEQDESYGEDKTRAFYEDVFYCSDRMGVGRLLRCQIRYEVTISKQPAALPEKVG